ncbi:uncharacterized protein LOC126989945 isoform X2 [Eriocheir sinensis]|uniref:uncharacterized protein LOC126989945 isoform X2 n=1 Tax=Eriocheir sinensis TaxID=95602 RepID=UPI0021C8299C|nr:uncharacterized protein LOC126989945 isoform X2 [Eriocheir sinensis]
MISCPENFDFPHVLFSFHRSCRYKGLAGEKPRATCDIKIKIRQSNAAESVTPPTPTQCPNAHTVPPRLHAHPVPPRLHAHPVLPRPPSAPTPPRPSSAPTPPRPSSAPTPPRPSSAPTPPRLHAHPEDGGGSSEAVAGGGGERQAEKNVKVHFNSSFNVVKYGDGTDIKRCTRPASS